VYPAYSGYTPTHSVASRANLLLFL